MATGTTGAIIRVTEERVFDLDVHLVAPGGTVTWGFKLIETLGLVPAAGA